MIDTNKYEGHLAYLEYELWAFTDFMNINATHEERRATYALLNDAPLLLAEVKRLREDNELYLACINSSRYKHEPESAFRTLGAVRQWQGRQTEHVGALRCVHGKHPYSFVPACEECGFPVDPCRS